MEVTSADRKYALESCIRKSSRLTIGMPDPTGHPLVDDELLRRVVLRMTRLDNYNIFYYYDIQNDVVYIIRVLYNKMDWQSLFKR